MFSSSLPGKGSNEIGLTLFTSFVLPSFARGITVPISHRLGNLDSDMERLKRWVILSGIAAKASLLTLEDRFAMTEGFDMSILLISCVTSSMFVGTRKKAGA